MRQQKPKTLLNQTLDLEDDRIDWAKKMLKKKRLEDDAVDEVLDADEHFETPLELKPRKKGKHKKPRPLVFDETSGRVFVKRQRKGSRNQYDDWSDDYD